MQIQKKSKVLGFSIADMLVAVAIIALFSTLVVSNYNSFRQNSSLKSESEKLSSLIRQAQIWSLSGQTRNGVRPPGGWGVHFNECVSSTCTYFLFADMYPALPNYVYDAGFDPVITEIALDNFVGITAVVPNSSSVLDIVFVPPNADTYLNGSQVDNVATITLQQSTTAEQQTISLNRLTNRVDLSAVIVVGSSTYECSDTIDNDGDLLVDFPSDPGCISVNDDSETDIIVPPPTGPTVEFSDEFTQGSTVELSGHTPEIGTGWTQILAFIDDSYRFPVSGSTLEANSGDDLRRDTCGTNDGSLYQTIDTPSSFNYEVAVVYTGDDSNDDFSVLAARIQDANNMYIFEWSTDEASLYKGGPSGWTQIGETLDINQDGQIQEDQRIALIVFDNQITIRSNGVTILNEIDSTYSTGLPGVGMGAVRYTGGSVPDCSGQRLDDFEVITGISRPAPQCSDGIDNDGDGQTDFPNDPDCTDSSDILES